MLLSLLYAFCSPHPLHPGLEIATDTVANVTKISPLATKNSGSVATLAPDFMI